MTHLPLHSHFPTTPQHRLISYLVFHQNVVAKILFNVVFTYSKLVLPHNQTRCTNPRVTISGTTLRRILYNECL